MFVDEGADDAIVIEEALGLPAAAPETESERMIRLGEMTPFGTVIKAEGSRVNNAQQTGVTSDFEKYLLDQSQLSVATKKAVKHQHGGSTAKHSSSKRTKMAAENDNKSNTGHETGEEGRQLDGYCMKQDDTNERELNESSHSCVTLEEEDGVVDERFANSQHMSTEANKSPQHKQCKLPLLYHFIA